MKYFKEITLKNGERCILRSCCEKDAESVLKNFNDTHAETDYLLTYPDESTFSVGDEADFLRSKSDSDREVLIGAFIDGNLVGTAGVSAVGEYFKIKYRADFGISISKDFWGFGIGNALTDACIESASKAGYSQLELEVVENNESAISLYKKKGFIEYGRNPHGFNSRRSGYQALVYMLKIL